MGTLLQHPTFSSPTTALQSPASTGNPLLGDCTFNCRESSRSPKSPAGDTGASTAVHGDAHRSVSIDPANYSAKTKAQGEYISYQLACKVLPSTLHAAARLWLHHRTHHSPARAPLLLTCALLSNRNQQTPHKVTSPTTSLGVRDVTQSQPHPAPPVEQHRAWEWLNSSYN